MNGDSTDVVHAAKRLAIRHVRDVLKTDEVSPLGRRQLFAELDRATQRMRQNLADEFRSVYESEFEDALNWARQQADLRCEERLRQEEHQRVQEDLRRHRLAVAETGALRVFREPDARVVIPRSAKPSVALPVAPIEVQDPDMSAKTYEATASRKLVRLPAEPEGSWFEDNKYFLLALSLLAAPPLVIVLVTALQRAA